MSLKVAAVGPCPSDSRELSRQPRPSRTAAREAGIRGLLGAGEFEELKKEFGA